MTHYQDSHLHPCVGHPVKSLSRVRLFATPCSPPGSSIHGILQARVLEWVAIAFSSEGAYMSVNQLRLEIFTLCLLFSKKHFF